MTELRLPPVDGWRATYWKLRRRGAFDFPVLGVAAAVRLEGGVCRDARIVLGAVASTPREVPEAARALVGQPFGPETIARAADAAARPAKPLDNTDLVYHYRKRMTRVYVARALRELAGLPLEGLWPSGMSARAVEEEQRTHGIGLGGRDVAARVVRGPQLGRGRVAAVRGRPRSGSS